MKEALGTFRHTWIMEYFDNTSCVQLSAEFYELTTITEEREGLESTIFSIVNNLYYSVSKFIHIYI